MADSTQQKTEAPTQKRREEARKEGLRLGITKGRQELLQF